MNRWPWHGIVAVILSLSVGISYATVMIITALQEGPVTEGGAALLNNLGGVLVGAVAGWLSSDALRDRAERRADRADQENHTHQPNDNHDAP